MVESVLLILFIIISFIISSAVHEFGHLLVGLKQGFKFYLLIVGPFGFKRNQEDRIMFYIEKDPLLWGGLAATLPQDEDISNFKKFGHVLLGGPIASLVFGLMFLLLTIITKNILLLPFGVMPLSMGIVCLIPSRNGAFYTDGGRWLRIHKNESARIVELAIWNIIQSAIVHGNHKKSNYDEIMVLINDKDIRTKYLGHYYAYYFYKDNDDVLNAGREKVELESLKDKVPKQMIRMFSINK